MVEEKTRKINDTDVSRSRIRETADGGKQVMISAWIPMAIFQALANYADPDAGVRWESRLLRRILREWLDSQKNTKPPAS